MEFVRVPVFRDGERHCLGVLKTWIVHRHNGLLEIRFTRHSRRWTQAQISTLMLQNHRSRNRRALSFSTQRQTLDVCFNESGDFRATDSVWCSKQTQNSCFFFSISSVTHHHNADYSFVHSRFHWLCGLWECLLCSWRKTFVRVRFVDAGDKNESKQMLMLVRRRWSDGNGKSIDARDQSSHHFSIDPLSVLSSMIMID